MIFILLIWGILGTKEGLASDSLPYEKISENLRHRKANEHELRQGGLSLIDEKPISKKTQNHTLLECAGNNLGLTLVWLENLHHQVQ